MATCDIFPYICFNDDVELRIMLPQVSNDVVQRSSHTLVAALTDDEYIPGRLFPTKLMYPSDVRIMQRRLLTQKDYRQAW